VVATSGVLGSVFTYDTAITSLLPPALIVLGLSVPLGAVVFVLDGVLIGAGDARYLALTGMVNLAVFVPLVALVLGLGASGAFGLALLMAAFSFGYLGARALTLGLRAAGSSWLILGGLGQGGASRR
jgi:Na+-driven multidrug efflux pump